MEIILKGNEIHKIFDEISFNGAGEGLFPKNIFILKFLQKCKITYILKEPNYIEDWSEYIIIPKTEEDYNKFQYHILPKNTFITEYDILTITNISNTEEDFFYFKMKYC